MTTRRTAGDIMIRPVLAARESWTVGELAAWLVDKGVSGAPVLDRAGRMTGVVSATDIVDGTSLEGDTRSVADIMTPTAFTVPDSTPLAEVARTMVAGRVHRLLVTRNGRVAGIVTTLDVLRELAGPSKARRRRGSRRT